MSDGEVIPVERLAAFDAFLFLIRVSYKPTLFRCEVSLIIFFLEQTAKHLRQDISASFARGLTVSVSPYGKQIICEETLLRLGPFSYANLLPNLVDSIGQPYQQFLSLLVPFAMR